MSEEKLSSRAAKLAHAEDDQRYLFAARRDRFAEGTNELALRDGGGRPDAGVREIREAAQGLGDIGGARDIAPRDAQHLASAPLAQQPLRLGARTLRDETRIALVRLTRELRRRIAVEPAERVGILDQRRCRELAGRRQAQEFGLARGRKRLAALAQRRMLMRALPPASHGLAQDFRHGLEG